MKISFENEDLVDCHNDGGNQTNVRDTELSDSVFPYGSLDQDPTPTAGYETLDFLESSAELLAFFDPAINSGKTILYPWQLEISEQLCKAKPTGLHPYKFCLCAANGSGKDAFVIAPWSLWFILTKVRAQVIITSASGVQLSTQTEAYISGLAEKINGWWAAQTGGDTLLKVRKRHISCPRSGSRIILFATDEEAKAEGFHPLEANAEMAIIVNEAKSVIPEIFRALKRCTGFNYWLNVSTPGEPLGDFHYSWDNWPNRRKVTYYDCLNHQSPEEFESDKKELGEHSHLFRSKWLAEFTFVGGRYVISQERLELLKANRKEIKIIGQSDIARIGLDIALSGNGDETVASVWKGNKQLAQILRKHQDATVLADSLDIAFKTDLKLNPANDNYVIFGDDGGVGRAVLDILRKKGWRIVRVLNQTTAKNKKLYKNRGAELWYKFARFIEQKLLVFVEDEKLEKQLASRKYKESSAGLDKLQLESKPDMKAAGFPSPDRADAAVLAFTDVSLDMLLDKIKAETPVAKTIVNYESLENSLFEIGMHGHKRKNMGRSSFLSLNAVLKRNNDYERRN